jgi:hypothetical protein
MQVRMKIGPKAGRVVDLVYHAARTLVEAGQAEDVHDQMRLPKAEVGRIDAVSVDGATLGGPTTRVTLDTTAAFEIDLATKAEATGFAVQASKKKRK